MHEDNGKITRVRVEALEKALDELKKELAETCKQLHETQIALAGSKTELRIFGSLIMALLVAMIGMLVNHLLP